MKQNDSATLKTLIHSSKTKPHTVKPMLATDGSTCNWSTYAGGQHTEYSTKIFLSSRLIYILTILM
jgi:hypothetical protein